MQMDLQQDFEKIREACPVCKAGINWYIRMDGKLHHVDFFYSVHSGATFECKAEDLIKKYITGYRHNNSAIFTKEYKKLMDQSCFNTDSDGEKDDNLRY